MIATRNKQVIVGCGLAAQTFTFEQLQTTFVNNLFEIGEESFKKKGLDQQLQQGSSLDKVVRNCSGEGFNFLY